MIDAGFVERLIRAVDGSGVDTVEIRRGRTHVRISKSPDSARAEAKFVPPEGAVGSPPAAPPVPEPAASPAPKEKPAATLVEIESPMVGTFYRAGSPGAPPFVSEGKRISKGDTLCIIEAMKLMNEFESEIDGTVEEIPVADGEPVEYGQVLFRVAPV